MSLAARLHDEIDEDEELQARARELADAIMRKHIREAIEKHEPIRTAMARATAEATVAIKALAVEAMRRGAARVAKR